MKIFILLIVTNINICLAFIPKDRPKHLVYNPSKNEQRIVNFWEKIFAEYSTHEIILHDSINHTIYEVISIPELKKESLSYIQKVKIRRGVSKEYKIKYSRLLKNIYLKLKNNQTLNFEEKFLFSKLDHVNLGKEKFLIASDIKRLRTQVGQRDELIRAYNRAKPNLEKIEAIFKKHNIPWEITRLPIIESMFQDNARSAAGAVGIWQILKPTGEKYLNFTPGYDPRNDPIKSTHAAAKILKNNYNKFQSWPLTILSYNIGRHGTLRAISRTSSRLLETIVDSHDHRTFGFSARNYFYELLAIIKIEKNFDTYFAKDFQSQ